MCACKKFPVLKNCPENPRYSIYVWSIYISLRANLSRPCSTHFPTHLVAVNQCWNRLVFSLCLDISVWVVPEDLNTKKEQQYYRHYRIPPSTPCQNESQAFIFSLISSPAFQISWHSSLVAKVLHTSSCSQLQLACLNDHTLWLTIC